MVFYQVTNGYHPHTLGAGYTTTPTVNNPNAPPSLQPAITPTALNGLNPHQPANGLSALNPHPSITPANGLSAGLNGLSPPINGLHHCGNGGGGLLPAPQAQTPANAGLLGSATTAVPTSAYFQKLVLPYLSQAQINALVSTSKTNVEYSRNSLI